MGIFKRIKDITTAEINGLLDQIEDPITMLNHYVREMEAGIAKGQQALSNQIFLEKKQLALILNTEKMIAKRTRQAKLAVDQEEEAIAKLALQEKLSLEKKVTLYKEQYETIKNQTGALCEKLNQLKKTYNELQHKRLLLLSRLNVAQSMKQMHNTSVFLRTETITKGVARAEERILMMEAEVEANSRLLQDSQIISSYMKDAALEEEVQKELENLKKTRILS
jgi:phage shock protein A